MSAIRDPATGVITFAGSARSFWKVARPLAANFQVDAQLVDIAHHVRLYIMGSDNGMSGWEVGIMADGDAAETDVSIRRIVNGTPENVVVATAHGVATGQAFVLRVTGKGTEIRASLLVGGVESGVVTYSNDAEPTFVQQRAWGFVSDVDEAVVLGMIAYELTQSQVGLSEAMVAVCDGGIHSTFDGASMSLVEERAMPADGPVSIAFFENKCYLVGGGQSRKFDVIDRTVIRWTATAGHLPGAADTGPGTTDANLVFVWGKYLGLSLIRSDPNRIQFCAIGEPDDHDTADDAYGHAIVWRAPYPIRAVAVLSDRSLLVLMTRGAVLLEGPPAEPGSQVITIDSERGATGPGAVIEAAAGQRTLVHTPAGVRMYQGGGGLVPLSEGVLDGPLKLDEESIGSYTVSMVYEPATSLLYVAITHATNHALDRFVIYDERVGNYDRAAAGWLIDVLPAAAGSTCGVAWHGRAHWGGRDGRIYRFDNTFTKDNAGGVETSITSRLPLTLLDPKGLEADVMVERLRLQLSDKSGPVWVYCYAAATAEQAFNPSERSFQWRERMSVLSAPSAKVARDPCLLFEIQGDGDAPWSLEYVEAYVRTGLQTTLKRRRTASGGAAPTAPGMGLITIPSSEPAGSGPTLPSGQPGGPGGHKKHEED